MSAGSQDAVPTPDAQTTDEAAWPGRYGGGIRIPLSPPGPQAGLRADGERLRAARKSIGWTQQRLAREAGYVERTVRKLEQTGGGDVHTLEDVVEALRRGGASVGMGATGFLRELPPGTMEKVVRAGYTAACNHRNPDGPPSLMKPDVIFHSEGVTRRGRDVIRERVAMLLEAFDPLTFEGERFVENGCSVDYQWTIRGTHVGRFFDIEPTGRRMAVRGNSWIRFEGPWIAEVRDHWDVQHMILQLKGEPPAPM